MGSDSNQQCNDHGDMINNLCSCDWGWFYSSTNCSTSGIELWSNSGWKTFQVIFTVLYLALMTISLLKLYIVLGQDKIIGFKRLIYRLLRSPKNLSLLYLVIIGIFRTAWLLYDPLRLYDKADRTTDRLLYETVYPLIYGLYASVLLVWGGLYQGMRSRSSDPFKVLRKLVMGMMVLAFPVAITVSVLKGKRKTQEWYALSISFVVTGVFLMLLGFVIYGILLCSYIEKNSDSLHSRISNTERNSLKSIDVTNCGTKNNRNSMQILNYHTNFQLEEKSWDEFISMEDPVNYKILEQFQFSEERTRMRKKTVCEAPTNVFSMITYEDKVIFRKLWVLLILSLILSILILVFFPIISSVIQEPSPNNQLITFFVVFSTEFLACFLIYLVFTTQIKVKDKKSLQFFTGISLEMNDKIPKMKYPEFLDKIGTRLHNFYS